MLYCLVGSRELDGGLMCTASHNPKAYTGAKLVREGAIALSGESGIQDVRRAGAKSGGSPRERPSAGQLEEVDIYAEFQEAALRVHRRRHGALGAEAPLKVVVDGGNGMAGPMVGPLLEGLGLELIETYWTPDGKFPDHEPNPLLPENRKLIIERVREAGADLGIAWDGDADRCFFIDETGRFVDGDFLTALLAESLLARAAGEAILYDVRASRAVPDTVTSAPAARRTSTASATRSSRRACAKRARCSAARSPATTTSATSTARTRARFRRCWCWSCCAPAARRCPSCWRPSTRATSSPARSTRRSPTRRRRSSEIAERYADAEQKRLDGISIDYEDWHFNVRPVEHRAAAAPVPGVARLARGHGPAPRRGARADPLVSEPDEPARRSARSSRAQPRRASIAWRSPRRFVVGRVNAYLIEDSPLTLSTPGPNSAKALDELEQALAAHGHCVEDIELLIVSHQHMDHFGLASILARRSGAEVAALERARALPGAATASETDLDDAFAEGIMLRHGIPPEVVTALRAVSAGFRALGLVGRGHAAAGRRLRAAPARPHAAGAAPARPQPVGHGLPRRGALDAARRRPPDRAHLLQPAARAPAGRRGRTSPGPRPQALVTYMRLAGEDARDGAVAGAARATGRRSPTTSR